MTIVSLATSVDCSVLTSGGRAMGIGGHVLTVVTSAMDAVSLATGIDCSVLTTVSLAMIAANLAMTADDSASYSSD